MVFLDINSFKVLILMGFMALDNILNPERIPKVIWVNAPWLNDDYVKEHGYIPISRNPVGGEKTEFGFIPYKHKKLMKIGDVIIFNEYENEQDDRFQIIDKELFEMILFDELGGPVGVVVPRPDN
jgi:hypothetical protein